MNPLSPRMLALAAAIGCGGAALTAGYGWAVALIYALSGVALAVRATMRETSGKTSNVFKKVPEPTTEDFNQPFKVRIAQLTAPLGPFQKFAFVAFLLQIYVSLVLILVCWLAVKLGWPGPGLAFLSDFLSRMFPVQPGNATAQAMLDTLFVPLALFNFISCFGFAAALVRSASPIFRNIKATWKFLAGSLFFLLFVWVMFSPEELYQTAASLKKQILQGDLVTYLVIGCGFPFFGMMFAYALPEEA